MFWPVLSVVAVAAAAGLHLWWRARFAESARATRAEIDKLNQAQRQAAFQLETQQEVLFNSMVEGLLLLDRKSTRLNSSH